MISWEEFDGIITLYNMKFNKWMHAALKQLNHRSETNYAEIFPSTTKYKLLLNFITENIPERVIPHLYANSTCHDGK